MYLQYGSYRHADNEVELASISKQLVRAESGARRLLRETWTLRGELQAANQSDLDQAIAKLEAAYLRQEGGRDAVFYFSDGSATQHQLRHSRSQGGVRVLSLTYPVGRGAEYATYRTYEIVLEADFPLAGGANLLAWQETITFQGSGGPDLVVTEVLDGPPIFEQVGTHTACYATQTGSALGHRSYPAAPGPFAPGNEISRERSITLGSPKMLNGVLVEWPVSWSYRFVSPAPLSGLPTPQPNF